MIAVGALCLLVAVWASMLAAGAIDPAAADVLGPLGGLVEDPPRSAAWGVALGLGVAGPFLLRRSRWATSLVRRRDHGGHDRGTLAFALVLSAVLVHVGMLQAHEWSNLATRTTDFGSFLRAAAALASGGDPYVATDGAYFYPPIFAALLAPLLVLPMGVASVLWLLAKIVMLVHTVLMLRAFFDDRLPAERSRQVFTFGLLAVTARFWLSDLAYGNTNVPVAWLGVLVLTAGGSRLRAGSALALATAVKVVPGLLALPLALLGRRRTLALSLTVLAGLAVLPAVAGPASGVAAWRSYFRVGVTEKLDEDLGQPDNQSLRGAMERTWPDAPGRARGAWVVASLVLVGAAGLLTRQCRRSAGESLALALWPGVMLAVSPGSWVVHYVGVLFPTAAVLALLESSRWRDGALVAVFALMVLGWTVSGWSRPSVGWSTHQSWFLVVLLTQLVAVGRRARAARDQGASRSVTPT